MNKPASLALWMWQTGQRPPQRLWWTGEWMMTMCRAEMNWSWSSEMKMDND